MGIIEERLKNQHLTDTYKRIAEFCLQNKRTLPLLSSAEIARHAGVSDVSVIRFARALGYDSFVSFKHDIQREIANAPVDGKDQSPIIRYVSTRKGEQDAPPTMDDILHAYQGIVQDIFQQNNWFDFDQAAKMILTSRNKYVLGIRFRTSAAEICANLLHLTTSNVIQIPASDYKAFQFGMDFTSEDCLIWFSFGRFTNFEKQLLELTKKSGIRLIVISDERTSQAALWADIFLQSAGSTAMPFYSAAGNCIIAELIANAVIGAGWVGAERRLKDYEARLNTTVVDYDDGGHLPKA